MQGRVERYIREGIEEKGALFFGLIDPPKQDLEKGVELAKAFYEGGADLILIGGSTFVQGDPLDYVARRIREEVPLPIVLFPGNIGNITRYAHAIYFMSLMNSQDPYWISGVQALAAPIIEKLGIEPLPTGYLVIEPGETVGWVGNARILPRKKPELIASYALAAEYMGKRFVIIDSGSGAPSPAPPQVIRVVRKFLSEETVLIIAGGIKNEEHVKQVVEAGAQAIHIGTVVERAKDPVEKTRSLVRALRSVR